MTWRSFLLVALLPAAVTAQTHSSQSSQSGAGTWTIATKPSVIIGMSASPDEQFTTVMAVRRVRDGSIVVIDSDPPSIRRYDPAGHRVATLGRKGSGPGEFRGRLSMRLLANDSLVVFDDELRRWTVYTPSGHVARSWLQQGELEGVQPVAYRRAIIHPTWGLAADCYRGLIDRFPMPPDPRYVEVFPDSNDRAWIRWEGAQTWSVYALDGRLIGHVTVPAGRELQQIGRDFVVLTARDRDNVEFVELRGANLPPHTAPPACTRTAATFPGLSNENRNLLINLRNLAVASAAFYMDYGHYAGNYDSLNRASNFTFSPNVDVSWTNRPHGAGFDAIARNHGSSDYCRILVGEGTPTWLHDFPFCSR